jgi:2-dehydropantoate 2-reductase
MKIAVIGSGAMGSLFGGFLAESDQDVWLLDNHTERSQTINKVGLKIEGVSGKHLVRIKSTTEASQIGTVSLALIFVKSYDTARAVSGASKVIGDETVVLTLQNGLGNAERICSLVGRSKVIAGTTSQGATVLGPGHIRHAGMGDTVIGQLDGKITKRLEDICGVFNSAKIPTRISDNVEGLIWNKLLVNVGINALTAITKLPNGKLLDYPETRELFRLAVQEGFRVAKAKNIKIGFKDPVAETESVCEKTASNISSMLQDLLRKKRTEIDYINGAICVQGDRLGIPTPINKALTLLIKAIETSYNQTVQLRV